MLLCSSPNIFPQKWSLTSLQGNKIEEVKKVFFFFFCHKLHLRNQLFFTWNSFTKWNVRCRYNLLPLGIEGDEGKDVRRGWKKCMFLWSQGWGKIKQYYRQDGYIPLMYWVGQKLHSVPISCYQKTWTNILANPIFLDQPQNKIRQGLDHRWTCSITNYKWQERESSTNQFIQINLHLLPCGQLKSIPQETRLLSHVPICNLWKLINKGHRISRYNGNRWRPPLQPAL